MDSNNLIVGEQNFVCWAFTLEVSSLQNTYMTTLYGSFGTKSLSGGRKFVVTLIKTQTLLEQTKFFFQTYINSTICIF
jgi:hypothetical protein